MPRNTDNHSARCSPLCYERTTKSWQPLPRQKNFCLLRIITAVSIQCSTIINHFMYTSLRYDALKLLFLLLTGWGHYPVAILFLIPFLSTFFGEISELRLECGSRPPHSESHLARRAPLKPTDKRWKKGGAVTWFRTAVTPLVQYVRSRTKCAPVPLSDVCRKWDLASKSQNCNMHTERSQRGDSRWRGLGVEWGWGMGTRKSISVC